MKTLICFSKVLFALPLLLALAACGKSSTSSTTTTATGYYLSNGICYASSNGSVVATSYCNSNSGYYMANGYCYSSTGSMVATTYCTSTGTTLGNGTMTSSCYGMYYFSNGYSTQVVQCNGVNCRGYTLYEYYSRQPVFCQ